MLQNIRSNVQGTTAKIIVGLIVISFSIFGIESILLGGGGDGVAEVNGEEISGAELQQAMASQARRIIAMMGQNYDPAMLDENRLKSMALDTLISRKMLLQSVEGMGLAVSEAEIGAQVGAMEQFQLNGSFHAETYKSVLSDAGYTPSSFKRLLQGDLMVAQLRSGLSGSEFSTPTELDLNASIVGEQRDFRYLTIPGERFLSEQSPLEEDIQDYYSQHENEYLTKESVDLEYLQLGLEEFREPVAEEAVVEAYELAAENFQAGTENRLSHILLTGDADSVAERLAEVQGKLSGGAEFAAVAGEYSDDIGSANRGGDLGYSSGDAFPEEIETAAAQLDPGRVSEPVVTDDGTHLLLVTERRETEAPTLEEMRDQLEQTLQTEEARAALLRTVETLRDVSFNADDLNGPADELALTVQRAEGVTRDSGQVLFANESLRTAAFSEDVLDAGHNSEVIELPGETFVVLRVSNHHMPEILPLADVRDQIVQVLVATAAREAVAQEASQILARLRAGASLEELANEHDYEWQVELGANRRVAASVSAAVLDRVFELSAPEDEPVYDFMITAEGDALVIELFEVAVGVYDAMPPQEQALLQRQILVETGSLVDSEYQRGLRDRADVVVL